MADFDYQKMNDYVSADPEVTKLRQQRDSAQKKIKIFFLVLSWFKFHLAISSQAATTPALQSATVMS